MSSARVTQRNIQFQESIEIREIPRNDSEPNIRFDPGERSTSRRSKSSNKQIFKTNNPRQKYVVFGIAVGGIVLICLVVGIVVGVAMNNKTTADNSVSYNGACTAGSNQCISSLGLYCPSGTCTCVVGYSWDTAAGTCTMVNNSLTYGDPCVVGATQCNSSAELNCTGTCTCMNSKVWNISSCVCPAGTFLNSSNLCETAYSLNHSCTIGSNQCDSTKDLYCNNSLCQCDYSTKYWNINFQACQQRLNYTQQCVFDSDCIPTLICPTVPGVCNCSQFLPDLVCNCDNTKYYDANLLQCVNRATFGGSCSTSANYTCLMSLYCNGGTCACPTGTTWVSANSTCVTTG